jgi:hypothetical protein
MDRSQPYYVNISVHPLIKPLLTYKIVENLFTEITANHNNVIRVGSRIKWYCELANLLLKEDITGVKMSAKLRYELK